MKICYLTSSTDTSVGWGRYANDLIEGVRARGHTVTVLTDVGGVGGIPVIKKGFGVFSSAFAVREYFKDVDLVHSLDVNPYGITVYLAQIFGAEKVPHVISAQGSYAIAPLHHLKTAFLSAGAYHNARKVVAISQYTKGRLAEKGIADNVEVITHGIHLQKFVQTHEDSEEPFILSVGALKRRKGYHISIPAFALLRKEYPTLRYKIVGTGVGEYPESLRTLAKEHGVLDAVDFVGKVSEEELRRLYRSALAFVLLPTNEGNHFEGFGLVFLEAAATGLPVIGTLGNGAEDAVQNGVNGILVPQNDAEAAREALQSILEPARWKSMSEEGVRWAKKNDLNDVIMRYEALYTKVLSK